MSTRPQAQRLLTLSASWVAFFHTLFALSAFGGALATGLYLHYHKIVKNEWYGYPLEWWPSVSATISEDHNMHDIMMITYLVLTIPWQWGSIHLSPSSTRLSGNKYRKRFSTLFFSSIIPLVYFYIQHKVQRVPGAYTYYAFIEWSLICAALFIQFYNPDLSILKNMAELQFTMFCLSYPRLFCAEVYLGFVFWTTLTALGPTIFYFSVWSMGLDGLEVLLFTTLSPLLLCLPPIRTRILSLIPLLRLLSLLSIGSYVIDRELFYDDSILRLQLTSASVAICALLSVVDWASADALQDKRKMAGFGLGLVCSVMVKYANYSLNPMWPIMRTSNGGYNRIGVLLGLWANLELFLAGDPDRKTWASTGESWGGKDDRADEEIEDEEGDEAQIEDEENAVSCWRWWGASLGFGALIFLIHTLFTDSGTVLAWVWSGYPVTGPTTVRHGYLIIVAMCVGIFIRSSAPAELSTHPIWYAFALVSCVGLVRFNGWLGFASGLLLCVFSISQLERFARNLLAVSKPRGWASIGLAFALSYLVYDILELAHTFTVAYAFVPGGELFREHTPLVLGCVMGLLGLGFFHPCSQNLSGERDVRMEGMVRRALGVAVMGAVMVMGWRTMWVAKEVVPYNLANRTFKAGIWTVHFGVDSGMWESQRRMRDIIAELKLDVVGLLESDLQRIVMGNRDLTQFIAEDLGMYVDLGPGPNKHTWGAALLSKFPIVNSTHLLLPSPKGELAPAIHATLDVFGRMVDVIVAHFGQEEDALDRELQSKEIARHMREAFPRPLVFLGYIVSKPHAPRPAPYQILVEDGKMLDIERSDYDRWCEYILFRGLRRVGYARVTRGSKPSVSDTEIQVGSFQVPPEWVIVDPERDLANYERVPENEVKESMRFSGKLVDGFKGHQYHVLKEQFGTDVVYYKP